MDGQSRHRHRSIPAHTGEPPKHAANPCLRLVYPRAYGGTPASHLDRQQSQGLSPRIRGNPRRFQRLMYNTRSIPAHTGEPIPPRSTCETSEVYPRAYGGTDRVQRLKTNTQGLSPRIRGNRNASSPFSVRVGSIPAHTGEPVIDMGLGISLEVYPRAYGGTTGTKRDEFEDGGLSPRIRGNHHARLQCRHILGSIPAHTGEPSC